MHEIHRIWIIVCYNHIIKIQHTYREELLYLNLWNLRLFNGKCYRKLDTKNISTYWLCHYLNVKYCWQSSYNWKAVSRSVENTLVQNITKFDKTAAHFYAANTRISLLDVVNYIYRRRSSEWYDILLLQSNRQNTQM